MRRVRAGLPGRARSSFKQPRGAKIRPCETTATKVTCPYCGVGCQIDLHTKDNRYAFAMAHEGQWERQPNKGMLCVKGRFGLDFVDSPDRLRTPLVRKDGELVRGDLGRGPRPSWPSGCSRSRTTHGADAIGFFASAKVTNEENYALGRFARAVIGTNNIDHCARL